MARYSRNDLAGIELPKAKLDRESLRQAMELFRYLRPYRTRFGAALAALFASSLLSLSFPYLAGSIVDAAVLYTKGSGSMSGVDRTALLLIGILALQASFAYFHFLSFATVGQRSLVDLRRATYARLATDSRMGSPWFGRCWRQREASNRRPFSQSSSAGRSACILQPNLVSTVRPCNASPSSPTSPSGSPGPRGVHPASANAPLPRPLMRPFHETRDADRLNGVV